MIIKKLFSSQKKSIESRPIYQKPKYKTYRELLQLDRPRKKIQYESSSEEEDFLQKLLKQEKNKEKKPKSSSRKNTSQGESRSRKQQKKIIKKTSKENTEEQKEDQKPKRQNKVIDQIQMFLAQNNNPVSKYEDLLKDENPQIPSKQMKPTKSRSITQFKPYEKMDKSKTLRKNMSLSNPILIDTKSIQSPPIIFHATNHIFNNTLHAKQQSNAYKQLIASKLRYQRQYQTSSQLSKKIVKEHVQHVVCNTLPQKYLFEPNIEPLNPNWRIAMTLNPLINKPCTKLADHKNIFRNEREEELFINSLRQLSKIRR